MILTFGNVIVVILSCAYAVIPLTYLVLLFIDRYYQRAMEDLYENLGDDKVRGMEEHINALRIRAGNISHLRMMFGAFSGVLVFIALLILGLSALTSLIGWILG